MPTSAGHDRPHSKGAFYNFSVVILAIALRMCAETDLLGPVARNHLAYLDPPPPSMILSPRTSATTKQTSGRAASVRALDERPRVG